jgi:hypothetical protein
MLAHRPAVWRKVFFSDGDRFVLERCCQRVVPPVEETKQGDDADDFDNLLFSPVLAQRGKHLISCRIRHRGSSDGRSSAARSAALNSGLV